MQTLSEINTHFMQTLQRDERLVLGEGNPSARLMLIGEAPGAQEAEQGRPFVGKAGKTLDAFLESMQLERSSLYITNAVKMRPTKEGKTGRLSNRPPTKQEIERFRPWLQAEIQCVQPLIVATLGNVPLLSVCNTPISIGKVHGKLIPLTESITLFPLYHPASLIYRRELAAVYAQDMQLLYACFQDALDGTEDWRTNAANIANQFHILYSENTQQKYITNGGKA